MKLIDIEQVNSFKFDFELYWCAKVQGLTDLRKSKMSQSQMAMLTGRSLKTIQRFENYQSNDPELMFLYNRICQPPDISIKTNDIDYRKQKTKAMKVEVNENKTEKEIKSPCLMKYNDSTNIILLVTEINGCHASGTSLRSRENTIMIGCHSKTWTTDNLVPFNGSITLSNN